VGKLLARAAKTSTRWYFFLKYPFRNAHTHKHTHTHTRTQAHTRTRRAKFLEYPLRNYFTLQYTSVTDLQAFWQMLSLLHLYNQKSTHPHQTHKHSYKHTHSLTHPHTHSQHTGGRKRLQDPTDQQRKASTGQVLCVCDGVTRQASAGRRRVLPRRCRAPPLGN